MATRQGRSLFEWIPAAWIKPVIALWIVILARLVMQLVILFGGGVLAPLGTAPWAGVAITVFVAAVAYGGGGIGLTYWYRQRRADERQGFSRRLDALSVRWVGGLGGLAVVLCTGWLWLGTGVSLLGYGLPAYPAGVTLIVLEMGGVNEMVNQAPIVFLSALLVGGLMGPATAAVFHGILQDTLADVAPPRVTLVGTALATTIILGHADGPLVGVLVVAGFVLAVAEAYRATETLLVPMLAYGLFNAITLIGSWVDILAGLAAAGHLFG